jgi:hypothetical protein
MGIYGGQSVIKKPLTTKKIVIISLESIIGLFEGV